MTHPPPILRAAGRLVKALRRAFGPSGYPPRLPRYKVTVADRADVAKVRRSLDDRLAALLSPGKVEEFLLVVHPQLAQVVLHLTTLIHLAEALPKDFMTRHLREVISELLTWRWVSGVGETSQCSIREGSSVSHVVWAVIHIQRLPRGMSRRLLEAADAVGAGNSSNPFEERLVIDLEMNCITLDGTPYLNGDPVLKVRVSWTPFGTLWHADQGGQGAAR